jgi:FkbM family methyltransferase
VQKLAFRVMYLARKYLFHTWIGKTRLAVRLYALVFDISASDLTKPVVFRDVPFYVDPRDKACVPSIVAGYFEQKELDVFQALAREADVFFDVGANFGLYSVIGCSSSERLLAYAFEPVEENVRLLERNIAARGFEQRIFLQPVAVSDTQGTATIHMNDPTTHSLEFHPGRPTRLVDTITLDGFTAGIGRGPDLIKIDVEGHEPAVLEGAWSMLTQYKPTLLLEFIPRVQEDVGALIDRLSRLFSSCFVVDEISGTVVEKDIGELHHQRGCNLVLTTSPRHAELVRSFVGTQ